MRWLEKLERSSIVAHLTTGASIRGVLVAVHRDCIVLDHAAWLGSEGAELIDGEAIIPRERLAWMQNVTGGSE